MTPSELEMISPHLELQVSKRARRVALRLDSAKRVMKLVVPEKFSMKKAKKFALEHQGWIREKIAELPDPIKLEHGAVIPILGQDRTIFVTHKHDTKITRVHLQESALLVETNQADPAKRILRYLKNESRQTLGNLAREKAQSINKNIRSIQIRDTKTRWGSCGPDGTISFSWRLIFAPWSAMDYVVAHEAAHLVHMDHSKKFWNLCESLSEDYTSGKKWIRKNGNDLLRYGA